MTSFLRGWRAHQKAFPTVGQHSMRATRDKTKVAQISFEERGGQGGHGHKASQQQEGTGAGRKLRWESDLDFHF